MSEENKVKSNIETDDNTNMNWILKIYPNVNEEKALDCRLRWFTAIPSTLVNLTKLICAHCLQLSVIPSTLINLTELDCSSCQMLTMIPDTLVNLTTLNVRDSSVAHIPSTLVRLTTLKCQLNSLLMHIPSTLVNLTSLDCSKCPLLRYIPSTFVSLTKLRCLECPLLTRLPKTLVNIITLNCSMCPLLTSIPSTWVHLSLCCNVGCWLLYVPVRFRLRLLYKKRVIKSRNTGLRLIRLSDRYQLRRYFIMNAPLEGTNSLPSSLSSSSSLFDVYIPRPLLHLIKSYL
jgi:hypothetical protein